MQTTHEAKEDTRRSHFQAIIMVLAGATFWGLSGTVAQGLFQHAGFYPIQLVIIRMLVAGVLLLASIAVAKGRTALTGIWRHPGHWWRLLVFGVIGLAGVQYTYFAAIQASNAATATLLQYLGPVMLMIWMATRGHRRPGTIQVLATLLALAGTWLLIVGGSSHAIPTSTAAVVWGLLSAAFLAFYTAFPTNLMDVHGTLPVVGYGLFLGGVAMLPFASIGRWGLTRWDLETVAMVAFVVVVGTLAAFTLYLAAVVTLRPAQASVLASAEPLAATLAAVIWLHTPWTLMESLGGLFIVTTVVLLAWRPLSD
jgi:drug/metabolite transporter (DMT)-like permease